MIQAERLPSADYRGGLDLMKDQRGNNDLLNLTRPGLIRGDLRADSPMPAPRYSPPTPSTPTRSASRTMPPSTRGDINRASAGIVREVADRYAGEGRQAALGRRRARADQQDPVAIAQRQRSRLPRGRFRRGQSRLSRADRRAGRRRRRLHPDRDCIRHAERQGRDHGDAGGGAGAWAASFR